MNISVSYCWVCGFPPPLMLNTNHDHREGKGQGLLLTTWEHPDCLGTNTLSY